MGFLKRFREDETAASAAEYAVILSILGVAVALAGFLLGGSISSAMVGTGDCIASDGSNC